MSHRITWAGVTFDRNTGELKNAAGRSVVVDGTKPRELLFHFLSNVGVWMTRDHLMEYLYRGDTRPQPNIIKVYISQLKRKLGIVSEDLYFENSRQLGYSLRETPPF